MSGRLGILLSGSGTTYDNLQRSIAAGVLPAEIVLVISSRADAHGLVRAAGFGHPARVLRDPAAIAAALRDAGCDLVAMCGFMRFFDPPAALAGKVVNIHPGLLPAFGGRGMYGHRVHAAVLAAGVRVSGCTAHLVVGAYDTGPILAQRVVPVRPGDDADVLAARVQAAERHLYPLVLAQLLAHGLPLRPHSAADAFDFGI